MMIDAGAMKLKTYGGNTINLNDELLVSGSSATFSVNVFAPDMYDIIQVDTLLNAKQDTPTAGLNINIDNNTISTPT
eukprot:14497243-Alexandrium_andersonii.AAC.1